MTNKSIRVLLIEDSPRDTRLLRKMLSESTTQTEVTHVERLGAALQRLGQSTFDAVLLDLQLPDGHGFDAFAQAQARAPTTPIVVLTHIGDEAFAAKLLQAGAQDCLVKGQVDGKRLGEAIRYAIQRQRAVASLQEERTSFAQPMAAQRSDATTVRVLIVEDEILISMEIERAVRACGYVVCGKTSSGEKAVEMVAETRPNLVLMDIRLKGNIDGIEAARRVRRNFDVPVVYLTAYADESTLQRAKVTEPFGYLIKPFESRELYTTVETALYKHKMEKRLRENERWLATTLRSIGDAVITTDDRGSVTFANPVAVTLMGWQAESTFGTASADVLRFQDVGTGSLLESPVLKVLRDGVVIERESDAVLLASDGREFPVDYNVAPLKDDKGKTSGAVLVFRDITKHKQMEQALLSTERLSAMGQLAATLAHEIKNPMQVIGLILESVTNPRIDWESKQKHLEGMHQEFQRLMALTSDVLSFARSPRMERRPTSIAAVVRYTLGLTGKQLQRSRIQVHANLPDDLPPVTASQDQLAQVFLNLVVNAIDAMPDGGELVIAAQASSEEIELSFTDNGPGLSSEVLDKLFDPFFTTKKEGTGMGLSISRSIVQQHGGAIEAFNAPGGGSLFSITLPVASAGDLLERRNNRGHPFPCIQSTRAHPDRRRRRQNSPSPRSRAQLHGLRSRSGG